VASEIAQFTVKIGKMFLEKLPPVETKTMLVVTDNPLSTLQVTELELKSLACAVTV
jgi:hypothetical protein